ncbi:MAG: electron transfer flavoprotein subunit beta/FixA family protein [Chitinophagales bacterium]|jgi:electron transfer flavoprotein beta subunit|nr:electron transfer flavoprotein subunit beta/FixA family protein [Sphingobacteriales bacterium]
MNFLVCVSKVPDTTAKIAFKDNNTKFSSDGVTYILNPTDEWYALVRALELKEAAGAGKVTVINVGSSENDQYLRKALAIGADDAVLIESADDLEPFYVAKEIANYAKANGYDIVITGKETIDYNSFSVGGMIAEFMDAAFVSQVSKWDMNGTTATLNREIEGGEEVIEVNVPFVISAQKGMAEQRLPNMKGIMMAKSKPLTKLAAVGGDTFVSINKFDEPKPKSAVKLFSVDEVEALVKALHDEAKVI